MTSRKLLQQTFGLTLVVLSLTGCAEAAAEPTVTSVPTTATPVPPAPTPVPPTATPVPPTLTPVPPTSTPVEVPPKTIQGVLFDANTGEPVGGELLAVVGWDLDIRDDSPEGNRVFIGGSDHGELVIAANGEFTLREVDYPLYVDINNMICKAQEGQSAMMAIRGEATSSKWVILHNEAGEPVVFKLQEGEGIYVGKVYVTP